ncbi:MAG: TatD family hydrolase [Bacteroidales bacterium]|nr:TatD family hydrolase [Bacteroidales bacterium]
MLIDTHSHLYSEEFDNDREAAVQRAIEAGVELMLLPAIDSQSIQRQQQLATSHPSNFRIMAGVHPTSIDDNYERELQIVEEQLRSDAERYVAIGEIGLDLYWDTTYRQQQEEALLRQLDLAENYKKPVSIHIRNAYEEFFDLLARRNHATYNGVLHCYSGTLQQGWQAIEMGFHLGIGGVLTYKKSLLPDIVAKVPLQSLVLETDAPYLAPTPFRGRRNESSYLVYVAQTLADIRQIQVQNVAETTSENAKRIFLSN